MLSKKHIIIILLGIIIICIGIVILIYRTYFQISIPLDYQEYKTPEKHNQNIQNTKSTKTIIIQLTGAIKNPGLYKIKSNLRVFEIIDLSGGFLKNADIQKVNLAKICKDGQKIHIPFLKNSTKPIPIFININTASYSDFLTIPGIGPTTAKKILNYRTENNGFNSLEELSNIKGISKNKFNKLKKYFTL